MRENLEDRIITVISYVLVALFAIATLLPFLNIVAKSISREWAVLAGKVSFWPIGFQLNTYKFALEQPLFTNSFKISVGVTTIGTLLSMIISCLVAYPLSIPDLRGRKYFVLLFIFAMLFNGGLIPNFLLMRWLQLTNTFWVLILPKVINIFNLLVLKSFFESIPDSIEKAAKIDGASNFRIFVSIVLPMSTPALATVSLYFAVAFWNNFFDAMMYISKPMLKPMQLYLYELITMSQNIFMLEDLTSYADITPASIRAASVVLGTLPILIVYPFLQRYFVKGITLGAVKE